MTAAATVFRWEVRDVLRSRWVAVYAGFFLVVSEVLLRFGGSGDRAILSLMNVVLILIPLVSLVFGTMYVYHAREFVELLLTQPVGRRPLFAGLYAGVAVPLSLAFLAGVGIPVLLRGGVGAGSPFVVLLGSGVVLTLAFTAVAFLLALRFQERASGLAAAMGVWMLVTVVYDGLLLLAIMLVHDRPMELPALVATFLNPVDLARVLLLMTFDLAALMGYTGAVFVRFLGAGAGAALSGAALAAWITVPLLLAVRRFNHKDF